MPRSHHRRMRLVDANSAPVVGHILGSLVKDKRERMVVATKSTMARDPDNINSGGNHRLNLVRSVEASLCQLDTDRINGEVEMETKRVAGREGAQTGTGAYPASIRPRRRPFSSHPFGAGLS